MKPLKAYSNAPLTLIDIGARAGIHPRWRKLMNHFPVQIIGFEPDEAECAALNAKGEAFVKYLPFAVGEKVEPRTFHLLVAEGSSSLFRPNYTFISRFTPERNYAIKREIPIQTDTLDAVLKQSGIDNVDYLKIDTEGFEREILNGATETLKHVFAIEVEVWFNPVFTNAPFFRDVDLLLTQKGFVLFDLAKSNYFKRKVGAKLGGPKGQLVAGDAIYFRDIPTLPPESSFYDKSKLVRAIVLAMQYCYFDFALEIAQTAYQHRKLSEGELRVIESVITSEGKKHRTIDFRGKHTAEKFIKRLGRFLTKFEWDYLGNW